MTDIVRVVEIITEPIGIGLYELLMIDIKEIIINNKI